MDTGTVGPAYCNDENISELANGVKICEDGLSGAGTGSWKWWGYPFLL
jgi:hypothetical protein